MPDTPPESEDLPKVFVYPIDDDTALIVFETETPAPIDIALVG